MRNQWVLCLVCVACQSSPQTTSDGGGRLLGSDPTIVVTATELGARMTNRALFKVCEPADPNGDPEADLTFNYLGPGSGGWDFGIDLATGGANLLTKGRKVDFTITRGNNASFTNTSQGMYLSAESGTVSMTCDGPMCNGDFALTVSGGARVIHGTITGDILFECYTLTTAGASGTGVTGGPCTLDPDLSTEFCSKFRYMRPASNVAQQPPADSEY